MLRVNFSASLLQIVDLDENQHSLKTEIIYRVASILKVYTVPSKEVSWRIYKVRIF